MIIFFDTSVLIRCYLIELGTPQALELWSQAHTRVGSVLLAAEMLAVFARKRRENPGDAPILFAQQDAFLQHWQFMDRVQLTPALLTILTRLHGLYSLRGADSLHLAAAVLYQNHIGEPLTFACADAALATAARSEGIHVAA
jgi:predicted nucleic acid-binding protein